jgi:glutaconate CoA-transferase subunit B
MMAVVLSRLLQDGEIGFIGVGSSGRAFELVTQIPLQAALLAQHRGVDFEVQIGPLIGLDLTQLPSGWFDNQVYGWRADALLDSDINMDHFIGGRVSVGFISGAQIDRYGNVNISRVRGDSGWKRLGGALALPEHCAFARRAILLADLHPRVFVEEVDFVTGFGHRSRGRTRKELALPGGGPVAAVTDLALLTFSEEGVTVGGLYPNVSLDDVDSRMGFQASRIDDVELIAAPTQVELDVLRGQELPPLPW